jgi:hypothetical protein
MFVLQAFRKEILSISIGAAVIQISSPLTAKAESGRARPAPGDEIVLSQIHRAPQPNRRKSTQYTVAWRIPTFMMTAETLNVDQLSYFHTTDLGDKLCKS